MSKEAKQSQAKYRVWMQDGDEKFFRDFNNKEQASHICASTIEGGDKAWVEEIGNFWGARVLQYRLSCKNEIGAK